MAYGKSYATEALEATKFATFSANYLFILNWNADPTVTSWVGINQFADMNSAEFSAYVGCLNVENNDLEVASPVVENDTVFASVNWVTAGAVTPVKNQGSCGSCWAFSATGSLEGTNFIFNSKTLQSYSEQQLVDCSTSYGNQGCNGGLMTQAFEYTETYGIELESSYPYTGEDDTCTYAKGSVAFTNTAYTVVTANSGTALQTAVTAQPVSVAVEADKPVFQMYKSGVITGTSCGTALNHGVLAAGFNTDASTPYWIIKNSWGATWGNAGYLWIGITASGKGVCGINQMNAFATFSG